MPAYQRARRGMVGPFQIPQPFPHLTAYENVLVAATYGGGLPGAAASDWAMEVLRRTSLVGKADRVASALPLIDRKRLEFAKALASKSRLILLDEIAAGLTEPFDDDDIVDTSAERIARLGLRMVPEDALPAFRFERSNIARLAIAQALAGANSRPSSTPPAPWSAICWRPPKRWRRFRSRSSSSGWPPAPCPLARSRSVMAAGPHS
jgi:hypothetical protein